METPSTPPWRASPDTTRPNSLSSPFMLNLKLELVSGEKRGKSLREPTLTCQTMYSTSYARGMHRAYRWLGIHSIAP
ncbi:hypothetical protein H8959_018401 [Pygathrix nigripes]